MKNIPATLGYIATVDDADFEHVSQYRWYSHKCHDERRPARMTREGGRRKVTFLHNEIMRPPAGMVVDHINGDPWDNRRQNLRICTPGENARNRARSRDKNSPFKGVYRHGRRFRALITFDGERIYLGQFRTAEEAAQAYDTAALHYHGQFAKLNAPQEGGFA